MLLGIDLGTGSVKVLLTTFSGEAIAEASHPYPVNSPQPGWAESSPADWWMAVGAAVRQVVAQQQSEILAIGLSGQMHGVVLSHADGTPLYPAILWADARSANVLEYYDRLTLTQLDRLANPITAGMAGCTLLWLRDHAPEIYEAARWILQPKDWLRFQLTGAVATEPSDASGTLLYDVLTDDWAWDVVAGLKLRSPVLPPLVPSHQVAGHLTSEAANHLNLPTGLPVVTGAADTAAAVLGSGLTLGTVQLVIGTGAQIITLRETPVADRQRQTHLFRAALPQQWYTLAAIQNAGLALEWVRNLLGLSWAEVYQATFATPPGCEGLTFLPYLTGDRTPHLDPHARGAWTGLGLHHTRAHLMRAALEGVAFSLKQGLDAIAVTGIVPSELRLAGGGTLEPQWQQLLADVLQVPLRPVAIAAASARGAALLAGLGIGVYSNVNSLPNAEIGSGRLTLPQPLDAPLVEAKARFDSLYPKLKVP